MSYKPHFEPMLEEDGSTKALTWKTGSRLSTNKRRIIGIIIALLLVAAIALAIGLGTYYGSESAESSSTSKQDGKNREDPKITVSTESSSSGGQGGETTKDQPQTTAQTMSSTSNGQSSHTSEGRQTTPSSGQSSHTTGGQQTTSSNGQGSHTTEGQQTTAPGSAWLQAECEITRTTQCPGSSIPLLVISLDGFRADYLQRNLTPVLNRLRHCGVRTPYIRSIFPTMTFPNHYTIVTGLYAESHGIVGNTMYDEKIGKLFTLSSKTKSNPAWWKGEPIWSTAKKQGKRTAAYFWVGSDVNISGIYPDTWFPYDGKVTYDTRINTVLDWVSLPATERPDLMLTYFDEPDHEGHGSGPTSDKLNAMIKSMDSYMGKLMDGLTSRGLHHCVNIIVLADHGMTDTSCSRELFYSELTDTSRFFTQGGTYGHISTWMRDDFSRYPTPEPAESVVSDLHCKSDYLRVFTKETAPKRHHILNTDRIGNVLLKVQERWLLSDGKRRSCFLDGNHGFDNIYKSMEAMFVAYGPSFKQNITVEPFENIELYNLMCEALGIEPSPNNGTQGSLNHLLRNPTPPPTPSTNRGDNCVPPNRILKPSCGCQGQNSVWVGKPVTSHPPQQWPIPVSALSSDSCLIESTDYSVWYSSTHNAPLYASYILSLDNPSSVVTENITAARGCLRDDPRQETPTSDLWCNTTKYKPAYLFEPYFSKSAASVNTSYYTSNAVPMLNGFAAGAWNTVLRLVVDYSRLYGTLSVVSGPVWDNDGDGRPDINHTLYLDDANLVPVPTHYYIVLMKCANNSELSCDQGGLDVVSFVLPHVDYIPNCLNPLTYLRDNVVRVRDIELLTGLHFLTDVSPNVAARLRTYLPVSIWPTDITIKKPSWVEEPCTSAPDPKCPTGTPPLILIGLDGFGADFLARNLTPVVEKMRKCGATSPMMRPVYPTVTFPNLYTIVTGLYPESHGIVANNMYDADLGQFSIRLSGTSDPAWWGGEPIWNTAMKQGKKTASFFWVGSEIKIQGMQPNITKSPYSSRFPYQERVATVLRWLKLPREERPDFINLYFDKPDYTVHREGTQSPVTDEILGIMDGLIGRLMDGLMEMDMHNCVNLIIVADHGMRDTSCDRQIKLKDYLSSSELGQVYVYDGPDGQLDTDYRYKKGIKANDDTVTPEFYLEKLQCRNSHMRVLEKSESPVRNHYVNNERIPELLLQSDSGWLVSRKGYKYCDGGNHGWDNLDIHLGSLFLAYGPSVKNGLEVEPFDNIELYNLMAELLEIDPAPNNGTQGALSSLLKSPRAVQGLLPQQNSTCDSWDYLPSNCSCPPTQEDSQLLSNVRNETMMNGSIGSLVAIAGPVAVSPDLSSVCQLNQRTHITGYNTELQYPLWTLTAPSIVMAPLTSLDTDFGCILDDPRSPPLPDMSCQSTSNTSLTLSPLLPREFIGNYSKFSTNAVLMYPGFRTGVWKALLSMVSDWARSPPVILTAGPVFDNNHDGLLDTPGHIRNWTDSEGRQLPVASHFFLTLLRCEKVEPKDCSKYGVQSFVLPHVEQLPSCWSLTEYIADNVVRLRDIELLTGLQFLSGRFNMDDALRLRLHLPTTLWERS